MLLVLVITFSQQQKKKKSIGPNWFSFKKKKIDVLKTFYM